MVIHPFGNIFRLRGQSITVKIVNDPFLVNIYGEPGSLQGSVFTTRQDGLEILDGSWPLGNTPKKIALGTWSQWKSWNNYGKFLWKIELTRSTKLTSVIWMEIKRTNVLSNFVAPASINNSVCIIQGVTFFKIKISNWWLEGLHNKAHSAFLCLCKCT